MTTDIIIENKHEILPTDYNDILLNIILEKKKKNKIISIEYDNLIDISIDIQCNDCKSRNLSELNGYFVCTDCGLYNDCIIDSGQEWRFYSTDDNKGNDQSRCDIPTNELLPKTSIGSLIGFSTRENKTSKRIRNMNSWNAIPYRESSLLESFNNITIMSQNSGINQCIIEEAKYMYKKVTDIKSSRRTKKEAMKAGCIMLACKLKGVPRNFNEIAKIFKLKNNKTFRKSVKAFEEIWNTIVIKENNFIDGKLDVIKQEQRQNNMDKDFKLSKNIDSDDNDDSDDSSDDSDDRDNIDDIDNIENNIYNSKNDIDNSNSENDIDNSNSENEIDNCERENYIDNTNDHIKINSIIIKSLSDKDKKYDYLDFTNYKINKTETTIDDNLKTKSVKIEDKCDLTLVTSKSLQECITKLHRFSCILGFNDKIFEACRLILIHIENEKYLDKHTPLSRTSAVIYYIINRLGININKHQILQTCEVSDVTINKCYQKLMKYKKEMSQIYISAF